MSEGIYQQFVSQLSTAQLEQLELSKRQELAYKGPEKTAAWNRERQIELRIIRRERKMRGKQLKLL